MALLGLLGVGWVVEFSNQQFGHVEALGDFH
jgi:hypothetical protein